MNFQTIRRSTKAAAAAGLVVLAPGASAVVARSSQAPETHAPARSDNAVVQDSHVEESLDYKLFLHRQARLVAPDEGAPR